MNNKIIKLHRRECAVTGEWGYVPSRLLDWHWRNEQYVVGGNVAHDLFDHIAPMECGSYWQEIASLGGLCWRTDFGCLIKHGSYEMRGDLMNTAIDLFHGSEKISQFPLAAKVRKASSIDREFHLIAHDALDAKFFADLNANIGSDSEGLDEWMATHQMKGGYFDPDLIAAHFILGYRRAVKRYRNYTQWDVYAVGESLNEAIRHGGAGNDVIKIVLDFDTHKAAIQPFHEDNYDY